MNISLAPQLPPGFSMKLVSAKGRDWDYTSTASEIFDGHINNRPILSSAYCDGTCYATVRGPGYTTVGCRNQSWPITERILRDPNSSWGIGPLTTPSGSGYGMWPQPILYSYVNLTSEFCYSGREPFFLYIGIANWKTCVGAFKFSNFMMRPAVLEYDITIRGNTITYTSPSTSNNLVALANNYCNSTYFTNYGWSGAYELAYSGLAHLMRPYTTANGTFAWFTHPLPGTGPVQCWDPNSFNSFSTKYLDLTLRGLCTMVIHDPRSDIVATINDLLFRAGIMVGSWTNITSLIDSPFPVHQAVHAKRTRDQNVFHSDIHWYFGAVAIQILTNILILPAYWAWWRIGVELTLSPFLTAKAFDAPLLKDVNSAAGSVGVVDEIGDTRLKLGSVEYRQSAYKYGENMRQEHMNCYCMGIAEDEGVLRPVKGAIFCE